MIDKLWSDWQNADPANKRAFSGGQVQALDNATYYQAFPNGAPPFLFVRFHFQSNIIYCAQVNCEDKLDDACRQFIPGANDRERDEHEGGDALLCLRVTVGDTGRRLKKSL